MGAVTGATPLPLYAGIIGTVFALGGGVVGWKLRARPVEAPAFERQGSGGLTGQELRVLEALAAGQSNKEIARSLGVSPNTVKTHVAHLFGKLGVSRRTQ